MVENGTDLRTGADGTDDLDDAAYNADDQDADQNLEGTPTPTEADDENDATLAVTGADMKYFEITDAGLLMFVDNDTTTQDVDESHTPDFEKKSSYAITIVATSGADDRQRRANVDVTVHVIDAEDTGTVSLTAREPQVGRTVVATVSDPDGGVTLDRWTWATRDATDATPPTCPGTGVWDDVTPGRDIGCLHAKAADEDKCLRGDCHLH